MAVKKRRNRAAPRVSKPTAAGLLLAEQLDLDDVTARLLQLYPREQAEIWLTSHNAHLGARPIDVLRMKGVAGILLAIDAEARGAYV